MTTLRGTRDLETVLAIRGHVGICNCYSDCCCDLDPLPVRTGTKESGGAVSPSRLGFGGSMRPMSFPLQAAR